MLVHVCLFTAYRMKKKNNKDLLVTS